MARFSAYPLYFCCSLKNKSFLCNELCMQHPNPYSVRTYFQLFIAVFIVFSFTGDKQRSKNHNINTGSMLSCKNSRTQTI